MRTYQTAIQKMWLVIYSFFDSHATIPLNTVILDTNQFGPYANHHKCITKVWQFAEMFAGQAVLSERLRLAKFPGISCDVNYGGRAMDLLTPAGMGFLC